MSKWKYEHEKQYRETKCRFGLDPAKTVRRIPKLMRRKTVIDLGAGEGKNAIFLARKGFTVTAVDISPTGISRCRYLARKFKVKVKCIIADLTKFKISKQYDIIISNRTLQLLTPKQAYRVIEQMKEHTSPNGINLISSYMKGQAWKPPFLFRSGELKRLYKGWKIIHYKEEWGYFCKSPNRKGKMVSLIARKASRDL